MLTLETRDTCVAQEFQLWESAATKNPCPASPLALPAPEALAPAPYHWTPLAERQFLEHLAETGSISRASSPLAAIPRRLRSPLEADIYRSRCRNRGLGRE